MANRDTESHTVDLTGTDSDESEAALLTDTLWQLAVDDERTTWPGCHIATFVEDAVRHVVVGVSQRRLGLTPASAAGWSVPYFPNSYIGLRIMLPVTLRPDGSCSAGSLYTVRAQRSDCGLLADEGCFGPPSTAVVITSSKCSWYLADRLRKAALVLGVAGEHPGRNVPDALLRFVEHAMMTWCSTCFVCGEVLRVTSSLRIKPSTCDNAACRFKHEQLGVGCDLFSELQADPKMASLLLQVAVASATNSKRAPLGFPDVMLQGTATAARVASAKIKAAALVATEAFCVPTPATSATRRSKPAARAPKQRRAGDAGTDDAASTALPRRQGTVKTDAAVALLSSIPDVHMILDTVHNEKELQALLTREQHLALRWVLASNRSHVHSLDMFSSRCRLPLPDTVRQFAVQTCVNEAAFNHARELKGSFFAWHGSSLFNWHAIVRNGLRCMSNTRYMSTGAAHGQGIYFAENSSVSWSYAQHGGELALDTVSAAHHADKKTHWACIALCEIAHSAKMHTVGESACKYYIVQDEDCIAVRFLCFAPMVPDAGKFPFVVNASALAPAAVAALRCIHEASFTDE